YIDNSSAEVTRSAHIFHCRTTAIITAERIEPKLMPESSGIGILNSARSKATGRMYGSPKRPLPGNSLSIKPLGILLICEINLRLQETVFVFCIFKITGARAAVRRNTA